MQDTTALRQQMIDTCRAMNATGLNQGSAGNVSVRVGEDMLITPSAMPYDLMQPHDIVHLSLSDPDPTTCHRKPSVEWPFHAALLRARPETQVVLHAHPTHCTALAMAGRAIPACHYMVAAFGGNHVPVAGYALFGTQALADLVTTAMTDRTACLLANHGAVVVGDTLDQALWRMSELETLARQYTTCLSFGEPALLSDAQITEALAAFADYTSG
jgi:L-fuculose-phosphate aldolase